MINFSNIIFFIQNKIFKNDFKNKIILYLLIFNLVIIILVVNHKYDDIDVDHVFLHPNIQNY
jgi:hypothetical protein